MDAAAIKAPFEHTNMMSVVTHTDNPYPLYEWMRDNAPLYWDPEGEIWAVSRYDDVVFVSRRTDLFCSGFGVVPHLGTDIWPDEAMINLDGKAHTKQRGLVAKGFSPRRIAQQEDLIRKSANMMVDRLLEKDSVDLVADFAAKLPFQIIGNMLGYPKDKLDALLEWTDTYTHAGCGPDHITEEVVDAFANFVEFHEDLLAEKKANPGDDLLSIWLSAELDGEKLGEDKMMYEHNLLLVGGAETTRSAISGGMVALMEHPDQLAWLRENLDDPDAVGRAAEEIIRWTTPFVRMARTVVDDVEYHGQMMKKGQQVLMLYPSANRDPRAFDNADQFDIRAPRAKPHLSFGIGKHFCLGAALARLELRIALEVLIRRVPHMRLQAGNPPVPHPSSFTRGLRRCPVHVHSE
jgi:cytochrome P450 family 142 subfamily A polypeptide 1